MLQHSYQNLIYYISYLQYQEKRLENLSLSFNTPEIQVDSNSKETPYHVKSVVILTQIAYDSHYSPSS